MNKIMKKSKFFVLIFSIIITSLCTTGCNKSSKPISRTDFYFDTVITITLYGSKQAYIDECFKLCDKYERMFSKTIPDSEISLINTNSKAGKYTTVSDETLELIQYGLKYSELSNGKFDITVGNLTALWNFTETSNETALPNDELLQTTVKNIGYTQIDIKGNDVLLKNPNISIDVGGIAKGYIADKLKQYLYENNIKKGMINLGGNILLLGTKTDGSNYNIGIQRPFDTEGQTIAIVNANDKSIVTSGVYERYFYKDESLYHHILDTETGYPIKNNILSVTILSDKSVDGDGLSTSLFALGIEDGLNLIETIPDTEAIFIDTDYKFHLSSGLDKKDTKITIKESAASSKS